MVGDIYMNLYNAINVRKSSRDFLSEPLSSKDLTAALKVLENFPVLFSESFLKYRFVTETKGLFNVKAPHYLIISGPKNRAAFVNAGFVGQKFVLWLHSEGLGSV